MSNHESSEDDVGSAPDLAGFGHERGAAEGQTDIDGAVEKEPRQDDGEQAQGEEIVRSSRSQELIHAADILAAASTSELENAGLGKVVEAAYSYHWSGMLPAPDEYNKYDEQTKERICRWNDAFTVDESARQDRLVDNEIKQQEMGVAMTFVLVVGFGLATLVTFLVTRDPISFGFLSVPVLNFLGNLFKPALSKSSRSDETPKKTSSSKL